ncbi:choice-of-anchor D domain-containing protein [Candidatus Uhrbacteria bacterium]|nr:choice-of-anchor D domain-containing protein [Candidatus Uhrbacteria bacterium]
MDCLRRTICSILILSLAMLNLQPVAAFDFGRQAGGSGPDLKKISDASSPVADSLPPFPEDENPSVFDWSTIDWDEIVTLTQDQQEYSTALQELISQQRFDEAKSLKKKEQPFFSDRVMTYYHVPDSVQAFVRQYREKNIDKEQLAYEIKKITGVDAIMPLQEQENPEIPQHFIQAPTMPKDLGSTRLEAVSPIEDSAVDIELKKTIFAPEEKKSLHDITLDGMDEIDLQKAEGTRSDIETVGSTLFLKLKSLIYNLFDTHAAYAASPLIERYDGIEKNPAEYALYYLSSRQNDDGSFGTENKYEAGLDIALLLTELRRTQNDTYDALLAYLKKAEPKNTREKIMKARLLVAIGEPYEDLIKEVGALQNPDGGFGIDKGYPSDVLTTLEFIWCVWASQKDVQKHLASSLYFVSNQIGEDGSLRFSKEGGKSSYYLVNKVAKDFKPFRDLVIVDGSKDEALVQISDKINALLAFLKDRMDPSEGTLQDSTDITDQIMTLETFTLYGVNPSVQDVLRSMLPGEQLSDGSFGHSLYASISAIRSLSQGDIVITDLEPVGDLANQKEFTVKVTMKNQGLAAVSPKRIAVFVDGVLLSTSDLDPFKYTLLPGDTKVSDVIFPKVLADRILGKSQFLFYIDEINDSNPENNWKDTTLTFAAAVDQSPAMPLYAVIHKYDFRGFPALNVRWQKREDVNRKNYDVLYRKPGESQWKRLGIPFESGWNGAFIGFSKELTEGVTYEFTLATLHTNSDAMTYFSDPTTIAMSADPKKDVGIVEASITNGARPLGGANVWGYSLSGTSDEKGILEFKNAQHGINAAWVDVPYYEKLATSFAIKPNERIKDVRMFTRVKPDFEPPILDRTEILWPIKGPIVKNQNKWTAFATGVDNVYFDHVDFWYWDPAEKTWVFLQSGKAASNQAIFEWDIPKELIGTGYKLKAIAYDYVGNASVPKEWGPFEIVDGSAAAAAVSVEGLVQNVWNLGEKKTMKWEIKSASPLFEISSVRLKTDTTTLTIKGSSAADLRSLEYTIPANAYYESDSATVQVYYCDKVYTCGSAESAPFRIVDPSPDRPSPWHKEKKSNLVVSKYPLERYMSAVFQNSDGSKEVIYREFDSTTASSDGNQFRRLVYRKIAGGVWQDPVVLVEHRFKQNETDDIYFFEVNAIKAQDSSIHIVFQRYVGGPSAKTDETEIFYLHLKDGVLQKREQISFDTTVSQAASIAVNASGDVSVVWMEGFSFTTWKGTYTLKYREFAGGRWSDVLRLTNEDSRSPLVVYDNGSVVVTYVENEQFFVQVRRDGQWWVPTPIVPRTITKKELDAVSKFSEVRDAVVQQDPNDPALYHWLPSIKKKSDLEAILKNKQFEAQDTVLYLWLINQYARGAYAPQIFVNGNDEYDLFFRKGGEKRNWRYDISYLKFGLTDVKKGEGRLLAYRSIMDAPPLDDGRGYHVARTKDGIYHIAYSRMWWVAGESRSSMFYVLFDGTNLLHRAQIASPFRYVDDQTPQIFENDNIVTVYFVGLDMINTADFTKLIQYRLTPFAPVISSTVKGFPVELEWDVQGGNLSSYSVLIGNTLDDLIEKATGLSESKFTMEGLAPDTEYFWQVIGREGDTTVYGGPWRFTTGPPESNLKISVEGKGYENKAIISFGDVEAEKTKDLNIILANSGNGDLALSSLLLEGSDAIQITQKPQETVKPNETTLLGLRFTAPKVHGDSSATLSFTTNDPDRQRVELNIRATSKRPQLVLKERGSIVNRNTFDLGFVPTGSTKDLTLTLTNSGNADLTFDQQSTLDVFNGFSLTAKPIEPLKPGASADITVRFTSPKDMEPKSQTYEWKTNDPDMPVLSLTFKATAQRSQLSVSQTTLDMGPVSVGNSKEAILTITNTGNSDLLLSNLVLDGSNSFATTTPITSTLQGGKSTSLGLRFTAPSQKGEKTATLSFVTNDPDKKDFTLTLTALSTRSELALTHAGTNLLSEDTLFLGNLTPDQKLDLAFTIANTGNVDLSLADVALIGSDTYSITKRPSDTIKPGTSDELVVTFVGSKAKGKKTATLSFTSSDPDTKNISLNFEATVIRSELALAYDGKTANTNDIIDLGSIATGSTKDITLTLTNTGNSDLSFGSFSLEGSTEFTVAQQQLASLAPASSVTIPVKLTAHAKGENTAKITLATNDPDGHFVLTLKAQVTVAIGTGTGLIGEYYSDKKLTSRVLTRTDARINFNWNTGSPDAQVPPDQFSVRWSGFVEPQYSGQYIFSTNTDDGARLWVDGQKLVDQWNDHQVQEHKGTLTLEAGKKYPVVFEYYDSTGAAVAQLVWETPYGKKGLIPTSQLYPQRVQQDKEGTGLKGEYYANANYTQHVLTRIDPSVNFIWGNASPDPKLSSDYFASRWRGKIRIPEGGTYTFSTLADDGVRLWVDGKLLINDWMYAHPPQRFSGDLTLEGGRSYDIQLDYYEAYAGAQVQLFWSGPATQAQEELIPQTALIPAM